MSKQFAAITIAAIASLTFFVLSAMARAPETRQAPQTEEVFGAEDVLAPEDLTEENAEEFFVASKDGYVAVYTSEEKTNLLELTDILVSQLTHADQEMINQGVGIAGRESLLHFLEDFAP